MKALFPFSIYLIGGLASLLIMMVIDFILGAEAEHLNAWVIINKIVGNHIDIPDSLAIRNLGLIGASALMLVINAIGGFILVHLIRLIIKFIHLIF